MNVYFISGLGADCRMFRHIRLEEGLDQQCIEWLQPESPAEPIEHYAERMAENMDFSRPFALVGLSFGGVIAQEIALKHPCRKVFLISSIRNGREIPWYYQAAHIPKLMDMFSPKKLLSDNALFHWYFGTETQEDKQLMREYLQTADEAYLRWSLMAITGWGSKGEIPQAVQIHGTEDRVFPIRLVKPDYVIEGGGHFMALDRAAEISRIITRELQASL